MKIIAFYLPQYHSFPENDAWWGKGFTEWDNVKSAKPLYDGHHQPKIPLNDNYYSLLSNEVLRWQADIARQYGIYGFCYYHYWFDGKLLMERPMENMLKDKRVSIPFCISWANEDWTRAWARKDREVLISQTYGDKRDWENHFYYLLPFLKDERYICIDEKPVIIIYRPELISCRFEMLSLWKELAVEAGLKGLCIMSQKSTYNPDKDMVGHLFDYRIEYQPDYVRHKQRRTVNMIEKKIRNVICTRLKIPLSKKSVIAYDYDDTWGRILQSYPHNGKVYPGAYVNWDNTPRHKQYGSLEVGYSAEKFKRYLTIQIRRAREIYRKDYLFLFAWNEWGEGGYLEPDEDELYSRLEAVKRALEDAEGAVS